MLLRLVVGRTACRSLSAPLNPGSNVALERDEQAVGLRGDEPEAPPLGRPGRINALHTTLTGAVETLEEFSKIAKAVNSGRTQLGTIETTAHRMSDSLHTTLRQANEVLEASAT